MYRDPPLSDANLGLASTRQLLTELKERGVTEGFFYKEGAYLAIAAESLMDSLPKEMLDFRGTPDDEDGIPMIPDYVEGIPIGRPMSADNYSRNGD
jgi:hypothetical protein